MAIDDDVGERSALVFKCQPIYAYYFGYQLGSCHATGRISSVPHTVGSEGCVARVDCE